eukprot:GHRR01001131.1.p1 GENE.GHRR01001131.1~~GHRR01001131.1.p1  ORF type:complete len:866 (+),score=406.00 GHRR01001131.1:371-2968(+)
MASSSPGTALKPQMAGEVSQDGLQTIAQPHIGTAGAGHSKQPGIAAMHVSNGLPVNADTESFAIPAADPSSNGQDQGHSVAGPNSDANAHPAAPSVLAAAAPAANSPAQPVTAAVKAAHDSRSTADAVAAQAAQVSSMKHQPEQLEQQKETKQAAPPQKWLSENGHGCLATSAAGGNAATAVASKLQLDRRHAAAANSKHSTNSDEDKHEEMHAVKRQKYGSVLQDDGSQQSQQQQRHHTGYSHIRRHHTIHDEELGNSGSTKQQQSLQQQQQPRQQDKGTEAQHHKRHKHKHKQKHDRDRSLAEQQQQSLPDEKGQQHCKKHKHRHKQGDERWQPQAQHLKRGGSSSPEGDKGTEQQGKHSNKQPKKQQQQRLSFTDDLDMDFTDAPLEPAAALQPGSSGSSSGQQQQQPKGGLSQATASRFKQEAKQAADAGRFMFKVSSNTGGSSAENAAAATGVGSRLVDEDLTAGAGGAGGLTQIHFGIAQARGARPYMEDRHTIITALNPASTAAAAAALDAADNPSSAIGSSSSGGKGSSSGDAPAPAATGSRNGTVHQHYDGVGRSYAAIFDGHNGAGAAETAARKLHLLLASHPALRLYRGEIGPPAVVRQEEAAVGAALRSAFRQVDDQVLAVARREGTRDGATALVVLRLGGALYAAHAGDSRAVLCRGGTAYRLTEDHKPHLPGERSRIEGAGGRVDFQRCWRVVVEPRDGRPGSGLAVSRSLGDLDFKEPQRFVECDPDITRLVLQPHKDAFIVLGSDGLWDVMSDMDAVTTAAAALKAYAAEHGSDRASQPNGSSQAHQHMRLTPAAIAAAAADSKGHIAPSDWVFTDAAATAAAEALLNESMRRGTLDNVTVIVMLLQWS